MFGIAALGFLALLTFVLAALLFPRARRDGPPRDRSETLEIQELHRGFEKLSERVEALEAILMEKRT